MLSEAITCEWAEQEQNILCDAKKSTAQSQVYNHQIDESRLAQAAQRNILPSS